MIVDQKVAIVTGAGGGIGAALAEALVDQGARVVVADINADKVTAVATGLNSTVPDSVVALGVAGAKKAQPEGAEQPRAD